MADLTQKQYLDLAGLKVYDGKIKGYVDNAVDTLDDAIRGVNGDLTAEIANRAAGDKAINDIIGDWKNFDDELTITDAMNQLAGEDGILHDMQDAINAVDAKVGDITKLGELTNTVDAIMMISDAIGNPQDLAKDTITESINANAEAIAALTNGESGVLASAKAYTDTEVSKEKTRAEAAEKAINDTIGDWKSFDSELTVTEAISTLGEAFSVDDEFVSMAEAVGRIESEEARATAAEEALGDRIDAHVAAVDGKVTTLVGTDEGKSVRTIANEELAAQLLSGEADADFKTLQELAAWLEDHPESVAEMNADIAANDTAIKAEVKRAGDAEAALDERLDLVEAAVGQGGSVDAQIKAAINALDSTATHASDDDGLSLQVAIVDGKLTSISGSIAAGRYDDHGSANAALDEAKTYADTVYRAMASIPNSEIEALFTE